MFSYIRSHEDEYIKVSFLSGKLGVTDRTIQSDFSYLEKQGVIRRVPIIGMDGKQKPNRFETISIKNCTTHMCTLENLYKPSNPAGFRTWSWDDYLMNEGKSSEELYEHYMDLLDEKAEQAEKRAKSFRKRARETHNEDDGPEM